MLFQETPGTILAVRAGGDAATGLVTVDGLSNSVEDVIITGITTQDEVAAKFTPTIGGPEYLYVFGDSLTKITVSLILFSGTGCLQGSTSTLDGLQSMRAFYKNNRLSVDNIKLTKIGYGKSVINGFLQQMQIQSQINAGGVQFNSCQISLLGWIESGTIDESRVGNQTDDFVQGIIDQYGEEYVQNYLNGQDAEVAANSRSDITATAGEKAQVSNSTTRPSTRATSIDMTVRLVLDQIQSDLRAERNALSSLRAFP